MLSVVIPTQNMCNYLRALLESFVSSGCDSFISEYIVVNDGSTDQTMTLLSGMQKTAPWAEKLKIIENTPGQGRFKARKTGALAAKEPLVFFSDTRVRLPVGAGERLKSLLDNHKYLMGMPYINVSKSLFSLYWDLSHQWIFRKYFQDVKQGFYLNSENYEQYVKGTGMLIVEREVFLKTCDTLGSDDVLSDDTLLLKEIVRTNPLYVCQKFAYEWEPRQTLGAFLWRLIDRGPGFVEYNFFHRRNRFFYAALVSATLAFLVLAFSVFLFGNVLPGVVVLVGVGASSVILLTRNPLEIIKLIPLHLLVLSSFATGVVYGLGYFFLQRLRLKQKSEPRR